MTQAAHTPGPWYVTPYKTSIGVTSRPDGGYAHRIAECDYWNPAGNGQPDREAAEANARLIASAPDLLEALQFYANSEIYKPHPHGPAFDDRDLSFRARAVLAKALGEQA